MARKKTFTIISIIIILALIMAFAYIYREKLINIIIPFALSLVIVYILKPIIAILERKNVPRGISILLVYLGLCILITLATVFVIPEIMNNVKEIVSTIPNMTTKYQERLNYFLQSIHSKNWSPEFKNMLLSELQSGSSLLETVVARALKRCITSFVKIFTVLMDLILSMIIAYYIMKDSEQFKQTTLLLVPKNWRNWIVSTIKEINVVLESFVRGQLLTAIILGIIETLGLFALRVKFPILLGLIGGIANIIPYFGPIIGAIPAVSLSLVDSTFKALFTLIFFILVQQIDNAFISPRVVEGKLGLHPVTTILAVLVGGEFFGIIGMLISVPVVAVFKVILKKSIEAIV